MVRDVTSPDGVSWRVEIDWMARRIRNPIRGSLRAARERLAEKRAARKQERAEKKGSDWGPDCLDCPGGADLDDLAVILLVIVAVVLLFFVVVWVAPIVWAILLVLFEFFFVTIAAIAILVWRTLLRRPWRVVARRVEGDEAWAHEVVGYRTARRRVREIAAGLALGTAPTDMGLLSNW